MTPTEMKKWIEKQLDAGTLARADENILIHYLARLDLGYKLTEGQEKITIAIYLKHQ